MKTKIERKKKTGMRYALLVIATAAMLFLPAGLPPVKAAQGDAPYSLTVYVANEAFVTQDAELDDVTLKIYKITDQRREAVNVTGFGTPAGIREKGYYLVIPTLGDEGITDTAGNSKVTTEDWTYTFGPIMITIPANDPTKTRTGDVAFGYGDCTDAVIYAKADRQPKNNSTAISAAPMRDSSDKSNESNVRSTGSVRTGELFSIMCFMVLAAAAVAVAIWRKGSGTFTR